MVGNIFGKSWAAAAATPTPSSSSSRFGLRIPASNPNLSGSALSQSKSNANAPLKSFPPKNAPSSSAAATAKRPLTMSNLSDSLPRSTAGPTTAASPMRSSNVMGGQMGSGQPMESMPGVPMKAKKDAFELLVDFGSKPAANPPAGITASAGLDNHKQGQYADAIKWLSWAVVLLEKAVDNAAIVEVLSCWTSCYKEVGEYKKAVADCSKVGCGMLAMDYVAVVDTFPIPNEKICSGSWQVLGGGNSGNALTCASRLGLKPLLISKVGDDTHGRNILAELETDGVDTSHITICKGGSSMFSFVIVDNQTICEFDYQADLPAISLATLGELCLKTRTCIYKPMYPSMVPDDLPRSSLLSALDGASLVYLDGEFHRTALIVAQEAAQKNIPILIDAERMGSGLNDLLGMASYVVCSEDFPQAWTLAPSLPSALVSILQKLPNIKFVIATLGEKGCIMLERSTNVEEPDVKAMDIEILMESLKLRVDQSNGIPTCISSESNKSLSAHGIGTITGRLLLGTAENIPPSELVDTTGSGDAFIGAVLYALCAEMPPEKMLPFAAQVAAAGCRALGARAGLPRRADPRLAPFLH